jgi:phosphoserine phosphatase RsbU/P
MKEKTENKDYKILIVDDNMENLRVLGNILFVEEYKISYTSRGAEAIEMAQSNDFDLILLDVMMPNMNGFEVCENLRNDPRSKEIPIIFLTAKTDTDSIIKGFNLGAQDYVTKPFNTEELLARVRLHIELKVNRERIKKYAAKQQELNYILNEQLIEIEQKNKNLMDSIDYAYIIQQSLFPPSELLFEQFPESFIFLKPKSIVSGDFYCFNKIGNKFIMVAADCTGHGIPGALLTMLGITYIQQAIINKRIVNTAEILKYLDKKVIEIFRNSDLGNGMDVAVCSIDNKENSLEFSGAKRPLYIIRNGELIDYKGSIASIGEVFPGFKKEFKTVNISLQKNDIVYLFSDGFSDQFGGDINKRFGSKRFKDLLVEISSLDIKVQKEKLSAKINQWIGKNEQVDDILVIGMKI